MTARDVLSLLQIGFSGFAAVMAFLAYRLIHLQVARKAPHASSLKILKDFTRYTLFLSLIVILSMFVERSFDFISKRQKAQETNDARRALLTSKSAQDCREALSGLSDTELLRPHEELRSVIKIGQTACLAILRDIEEVQ